MQTNMVSVNIKYIVVCYKSQPHSKKEGQNERHYPPQGWMVWWFEVWKEYEM